MNAPARSEMLVAQVGDATITMPKDLAALAYMEKMIDGARALTLVPGEAFRTSPTLPWAIPAIGTEMDGGKFAGVTVHNNVPMGLVKLPNDAEMAWAKGPDWCKQHGGEMPTRFDLLALWTNLRADFRKEAYWTSEECPGGPGYAYCQDFGYGGQGWNLKSNELRVVAVRRVPL